MAEFVANKDEIRILLPSSNMANSESTITNKKISPTDNKTNNNNNTSNSSSSSSYSHIKNNKFTSKLFKSANLRRISTIIERKKENEYEESATAIQRYRPKPIDDLVKETSFTKKEIQLLYRGFKQECPSGIVNEQMFKEIYAQFFPHGDSNEYAHLVFNTIDLNCDGIINFEDFLIGLSILSRGSLDDKIKWIFNLYDINRDGKLTKDELDQVVSSIYDLMGKFTDPPIDESTYKRHAELVFKKFDVEKTGEITQDEFIKACYKDATIVNSISMLDTII